MPSERINVNRYTNSKKFLKQMCTEKAGKKSGNVSFHNTKIYNLYNICEEIKDQHESNKINLIFVPLGFERLETWGRGRRVLEFFQVIVISP